jgi:hypothetical protein
MPTSEALVELRLRKPLAAIPVATENDPTGVYRAIERGHRSDELEQRFHTLVERWRGSRNLARTATGSAMHPAYQEIIGLGRDGLPLILRELQREVDHWFWALRAITGVDPVAPSDRGDLDKMAHAWLRWARSQGLSW